MRATTLNPDVLVRFAAEFTVARETFQRHHEYMIFTLLELGREYLDPPVFDDIELT